MSGAGAIAAGTGIGAALIGSLWLWQRHGLAVWLEMGLSFCM